MSDPRHIDLSKNTILKNTMVFGDMCTYTSNMDINVPERFHWFASSECLNVEDGIDDRKTCNEEI